MEGHLFLPSEARELEKEAAAARAGGPAVSAGLAADLTASGRARTCGPTPEVCCQKSQAPEVACAPAQSALAGSWCSFPTPWSGGPAARTGGEEWSGWTAAVASIAAPQQTHGAPSC